MPPLYKYLPAKYVDGFTRRGEILFRALSYFRDFEDAQTRGDEFEGTRLHLPKTGLAVTISKTQEKISLPHALESAVNEDDIFVFCLSTILSAELATQFKAEACVEIINPARFISGIRAALQRRPSVKNKDLVCGGVKYYNKEDLPIVDWALPERITMSKLRSYEGQCEYRIAFAINDAFAVHNTRLRLAVPGERRLPPSPTHPMHLLKLGSLQKFCKVHRFVG
jgi:hypothetical protein